MSTNWFDDIAEMHSHFGIRPPCFDGEFLRFRQKFIDEEVIEMDDAIQEKDPEALVDALIDICVVAIGTLEAAGVDGNKAWNEVHRANMSKQKGHNSTRQNSQGFDLIKPQGWKAPSHKGNTGILEAAIEEIHARRIGFSNVPSHVKVMDKFRDFALSKDNAYNGNEPEESHASYYPDGIINIVYEIFKKVKRLRNGLKKIEHGTSNPLVAESVHDGFRDINIYAAIGYAYMAGELEGQQPNRDIFNRPIK